MNRVCYRFIDSPYRKEFFIDENRTAYSGTDRIRAMLDQHEVEYSRIIIPTTSIVISYMAMQRVLNSDVIP